MRISALAPWFGGKRTMASEIVRELGDHNAYDEPCCGALSVLMTKPQAAAEMVNDLHGDVINLAMCTASRHWRELQAAIDRLLIAEPLLKALRQDLAADYTPPADPNSVSDADVERAARYLALSWMTRNGVAGTERVNYQVCVRWTQGGGSPGIRWRAVVESLPAWHERLLGVVILNRDMFEILPKVADEPGRAIYVDPPYLKHTRGNGVGSRYLYDFGDREHERLARELARFKRARVVVSYYDDPVLADLYRGWTIWRMYRQKNLHVQNRRGAGTCTAPEVLILNGESYAVEQDGRLFA